MVERAAREEYVLLQILRFLFQRKQVWIDCNTSNTMTVALYCTNVDNRSVHVFKDF